MRAKKSFEVWMAEVNAFIKAKYGLDSNDLPDCCYDDWYENGVGSKAAARKALKNAGE